MSQQQIATLIDPAHFRRVLGRYSSGVCVITASGPGNAPMGMTVSSFTSVSLDPPLVAFLPMKGSRVYKTIVNAGRFAVNILAGDQAEISRKFASPVADRFKDVSWRHSSLGSPILDDTLAWIDCQVHAIFDAGDHDIVVGAVDSLDLQRSAGPLISFQSGYGRFSAPSIVTATEDGLAAHLRLAELARPRLESISSEFGVQATASALVRSEVIQLAWVSPEDTDLATNMIGLRLPFVAPFGLLFAAWASDEVRSDWIGRNGEHADFVRGALLSGVERARMQGWMELPDHAELRDIEAGIARIASHGNLPEMMRDLDEHIFQYASAYAALSTEQPRGLAVPVFDQAGKVVLALTVQRLPVMDRHVLDRCREALIRAANELTAAIDGMAPGQ